MKNDSQHIKKNILLFSTKIFIKDGIINTSVDKIVKEMKISKKTVYKYFKNKDELVNQIVCDLIEQSKKEIEKISKRNFGSFNMFINLIEYISREYFKYYRCFLPDLKLKYRNIFNDKYLLYENEIVIILIRIIKKCQSQGFLIKTSPEFLAKSYFTLLQRFINKENEDTILKDLDSLNIFSFIYINALLSYKIKSKYLKIAETKLLLISSK